MKRNNSRFTTDQLNQVISNWEVISKLYNGKLEVSKTTVDNRPLINQAITSDNVDFTRDAIYHLEITIPFNGDEITIISSENKYPIFQFEILNSDFSFTISNEDYFEKFLKLFGSKELQTGDKEFDQKYLLDTNDKNKLNNFLDDKIRNWLELQNICYFDLNTPKSKDRLSIYYVVSELSVNTIKEQIEIFKYCIEKIENICSQ